MNDTANGKEKQVELESIQVEAWASWSGDRASRDFRTGDKKTKFTVGLPIPENDEQAVELYGIPLAKLIVKGVIRHSYDKDTDLGNLIAEWLEKGEDMTDHAGDVADAIEADFKAPDKERKGESATEKAARKELESLKKSSGLSYAEMVAKIKAAGL